MRTWFIYLLTLACATVAMHADTWSTAVTQTQQALRSVDFADHRRAIAVGDNGTALRSMDGGKTWHSVRTDVGEHFSDVVAFSDQRWIMVSNIGSIMQTSNAGAAWKRDLPSATHAYTSIAAASPDVLVVVGGTRDLDSGVIMRSTDAGATWRAIADPFNGSISHYLVAVDFISAERGVIVGNERTSQGMGRGVIMTTSDGGATWTQRLTTQELVEFTDVEFASRSNIVAITNVGSASTPKIYLSYDVGASWTFTTDEDMREAAGFVMVSAYDGYAVGDSKVLRTIDGGRSWEVIHETMVTPHLLSIDAPTPTVVAAVGILGGAIHGEIDCDAPVLVQDLPAERTVTSGSNVALMVRSNGVPYDTYQWYKNDVAINQATDSMYTFWPVRVADGGVYRVDVTNICGVTQSTSCELTVRDGGVLLAAKRLVEFGLAPVNEVKDTTLVGLLRNEGTTSARIRSARIIGQTTNIEVVTPLNDVTIAPGASLDVQLRFRPAARGQFWQTLIVETDSDIRPIVHLMGSGYRPADASLQPVVSAVDFGIVSVLEAKDTVVPALIKNTSNAEVNILAAWILEGDQLSFAAPDLPEFPITLQPGETFGTQLLCTADGPRVHRSTILFISDKGRIEIPLVALSQPDMLNDVIDLGDIASGQERDTIIEFHHIYDLMLTVKTIELPNGAFRILGTEPQLPASLGGYEPLKVRVRVRGDQSGPTAAPVRVTWELEEFPFIVDRRIVRANVSAPTSVDDVTDARPNVYPNPASGDVVLTLPGVEGVVRVEIVDAVGQVHRRDRVEVVRGRAVYDVSGLATGAYLVAVSSGAGQTALPLIVK
jgi:photosystem II stability/assembly factor-like uncharacterized protein